MDLWQASVRGWAQPIVARRGHGYCFLFGFLNRPEAAGQLRQAIVDAPPEIVKQARDGFLLIGHRFTQRGKGRCNRVAGRRRLERKCLRSLIELFRKNFYPFNEGGDAFLLL